MFSSLVDAVLLAALVVTTIRVGTMYRELRRLRTHHDDYRRIFGETGEALAGVERAVRQLNGEGRDVLLALAGRIDEARRLEAQLGHALAAEDRRTVTSFQPLALAEARRRA